MTRAAGNYGKVLYEMEIPKKIIEEAAALFKEVPQLSQALSSPIVTRREKYCVIDRVFPETMRNFIKVICDHQKIESMDEIFMAYHEYACEKAGILIADLYYVTEPDEKQLHRFKQILCGKFKKQEVELRLVKTPELIGGFILRVGNIETDRSIKGRLRQLEQILMQR